jgi:peptidoglycan/LPS O-acetylase OafA/YrhL
MQVNETLRRNRTHLAALDGLRGFAAVSVVLFHIGHWLSASGLATNCNLGVELFFCLSGYVMSVAYLPRVSSLSMAKFSQIRLVRLMPLIFIATVMSASYVVLRKLHFHLQVPYQTIGIAALLGVLDLPFFTAPRTIGGPQIFPLNGPQYTLLLELIANLFWWGMRRFNQAVFSVVLAVSCFLFLPFTGFLGDIPSTFLWGLPHVGASFFAGVALFHLQARLPQWHGWTATFWVLVVVMIVLFYMPIEVPRSVQLVWLAVVSPGLVLAGSRVRLSHSLSKTCLLAGAISYPVYCLQYPIFCWINGAYRAAFGPQNIAVEGPLVTVTVVAVGYVILKLYDEPVRRFLTGHLLQREATHAPAREAPAMLPEANPSGD